MLRHIILSSAPGIREKISYGIPFFYLSKNLCYFNPKKGGLDVGFIRGHEIEIAPPGFERKNRKQVKSFHFTRLEDLDYEGFDQVLQLAIQLDTKNKPPE